MVEEVEEEKVEREEEAVEVEVEVKVVGEVAVAEVVEGAPAAASRALLRASRARPAGRSEQGVSGRGWVWSGVARRGRVWRAMARVRLGVAGRGAARVRASAACRLGPPSVPASVPATACSARSRENPMPSSCETTSSVEPGG
eukprot:scaffold10853_cov54-Phaeocystis_antarctica.AAC.6